MPVFHMHDNRFVNSVPGFLELGITQISIDAFTNYYWDRYLANPQVVFFLKTLSYLSAGSYSGRSSGMNHDVLSRLVKEDEFPHLVKLDVMGVSLSWMVELIAEGANLPRLLFIITGFANDSVSD